LANYEIIVVTGHRPEEIEYIIKEYGARIVHNHDYEQGMTTSFQAGLRAIDENVEAVFMILGDTFGFNPDLLGEMELKMASTVDLIVSPLYNGKPGHPVLIASELFQEFLNLESHETMRDVILRHEDEHSFVPGGIWTKIDLDTPEDYETIKKLWTNHSL
jgi:molybdenum cofactor cytidylyltransferase